MFATFNGYKLCVYARSRLHRCRWHELSHVASVTLLADKDAGLNIKLLAASSWFLGGAASYLIDRHGPSSKERHSLAVKAGWLPWLHRPAVQKWLFFWLAFLRTVCSRLLFQPEAISFFYSCATTCRPVCLSACQIACVPSRRTSCVKTSRSHMVSERSRSTSKNLISFLHPRIRKVQRINLLLICKHTWTVQWFKKTRRIKCVSSCVLMRSVYSHLSSYGCTMYVRVAI